ncbi:hypothetical protein ES705_12016 [subsurface metagenome]
MEYWNIENPHYSSIPQFQYSCFLLKKAFYTELIDTIQ